jgi:GNAT superfamily N-acetyltransferase
MEFSIREAAIEDAEAIAHVHVESWRCTYPGIVPDAYLDSLSVEDRAAKWKEKIATGDALIHVAENRIGIFGFASGGGYRPSTERLLVDGFDGELYAIYLLREHQRLGAGRLLVRSVVRALIGRGHKSMVAWVLEANPSVSFYRRLGGVLAARAEIRIGGVLLPELAFGWPSIESWLYETAQSA